MPPDSGFEKYLDELLERARLDSTSLTDDDFVGLARFLIAHEVTAGGPYMNDAGLVSHGVNSKVAAFFALFGQSLPALDAFIGTTEKDTDTPNAPVRLTPIQKAGRTMIATVPHELRADAHEAYGMILRADARQEISAISSDFASSLPGYSGLEPDVANGLGVANLMAWTAYSLYDDFIDNDGDPRFLPVANVTHRRTLALYLRTAPDTMKSICHDVFDGMDAANSWEVAHCRFPVDGDTITIEKLPRYGRLTLLAARARAHVLGPLIVARLGGHADYAAIAKALDHYLIARQLNDDMHDWADDFMRGHISPVVAMLLSAIHAKPGEHDRYELLNAMKTAFWQTELNAISALALRHIRQARQLLCARTVGMDSDSRFITRIIGPIEDGLCRGITRHENDKRFLAAYSKPASTIAR